MFLRRGAVRSSAPISHYVGRSVPTREQVECLGATGLSGIARSSPRGGGALADPYSHLISFTYDFFHWPNFDDTITDTHFVARDRMGRLMAFLCRQIEEGRATTAYGVGVEEGSTLLIDKDGLGTVYGEVAYVVVADHFPDQCVAGTPVTYSGYKIWRITAGNSYDFKNRPTTGFYTRSVHHGVIDQSPY